MTDEGLDTANPRCRDGRSDTRAGILQIVGLTVAFGLILFGFQTGNLMLTSAGGVVAIGSAIVSKRLRPDKDLSEHICWQFGPFKAYELECPYCEKSWCSMLLFGSLAMYFVHCFRNQETHPSNAPDTEGHT